MAIALSTFTSEEELKQALPLLVFTPVDWATQALKDPLSLLSDHAHLEKKAAANALSLLQRWPETNPTPNVSLHWGKLLTDIARDEVAHLNIVLKHIAIRGGVFAKWHENTYANDLRVVERRGEDPNDLVDRLLVSALIEARSCERFCLLADVADDTELAQLYRGLWNSEHGHYKAFLELAELVQPQEMVAARWQEMLVAEAEIIQKQKPGARIHSWFGGEGVAKP